MVSSAEILAAFREVSNTKQLDRAELYALLTDGILAALAKKYGPNVQAEVDIDDGKGDIRIVLLKTVVENVEDSSNQISVDDAKSFDESFEPGDVMEEPVDFAVFGRAAVQAASQASPPPKAPAYSWPSAATTSSSDLAGSWTVRLIRIIKADRMAGFRRQLVIVITAFLMVMLLMLVLSYIGYDHWTYEP